MKTTFQIAGVDVLVEGQGADTIVMIHGWPDTHRLWDATVQALAPRYRCVRFTLPGFDIAKPRRAWSMAGLMDFFKAVVEQASPGRPVVLLLHDWGCMFGYQFMALHPSLVDRVIGVDIGDAGSRAHMRAIGAKEKALVVGYQVWLAAAWRIGGAVGDRMTRSMARMLHCPSDPRFIGSCMDYPYYIQWTGTHGSYRGRKRVAPHCPMLYIYATRKAFMLHSPEWADALARQPGNRVLAFETGHWVMTDKPREFQEAVLAWLSSL